MGQSAAASASTHYCAEWPIRAQARHAPDALLDAIGLCRGFVRWLAWSCRGLARCALAEPVQAPDLVDQPVPDHHLRDRLRAVPTYRRCTLWLHHPPHSCNKHGCGGQAAQAVHLHSRIEPRIEHSRF